MPNELSIKISANARAAAADFGALEGSIRRIETTARTAGTAIDSMLARMQAGYRRARVEAEGLARANQRLSLGQFAAGRIAGYGVALGATLGAAGIGFASQAVSTGFEQYLGESSARALLSFQSARTFAGALPLADAALVRSQFGLTREGAYGALGQSLRFTHTLGRGSEAGQLTRALTNALAAGGRGPGELGTRLQQLQTGQDELFDVLGPVKIGSRTAGSPEQIYKAYAAEILNVRRELTDLEKTQARYYAVLQAGAQAEGAAAARLETLAGRYETLTARVKDFLSAAVGNVADSATGRGILAGASRLLEDATGLLEGGDRESPRSIFNLSASAGFNAYGRFRAAPLAFQRGVAGGLLAGPQNFFLGFSQAAMTTGEPAPAPVAAPGPATGFGRFIAGIQGAIGAYQQLPRALSGVTRALRADEQLQLLRASATDPYAGARRQYAVERAKIEDEVASGKLTRVAGAQLAGIAGETRDTQIAQTRQTILGQLEDQLQSFRARFSGAGNPVVKVIEEGRAEAARLNRELAKLGPTFAAGADAARIALRQGTAVGLAEGVAGNIANVAAIDARRAEFGSRYEFAGYQAGTGFYGQRITTPQFRRVAGESARQSIARIFGAGEQIGSVVNRFLSDNAGANGIFSASEAGDIADRLSRQYLATSLARFRPEQFGADQRRQYDDLLLRVRQDEVRQALLALVEMRHIRRDVAALRSGLVGHAQDDPKQPSIEINLTNRVAGTVARFADAAVAAISSGSASALFNDNTLFGSGDTLTNL